MLSCVINEASHGTSADYTVLNGVPDGILICRSPNGFLQSLLLVALIFTPSAALSAQLAGSEGPSLTDEAD